ncbi:MAG TPA: hypothetical protein VGF45_01995, partial [Polyangia bacterium]
PLPLSLPIPALRLADFVGTHLPYDLFVIASSQDGPAMLARVADLGIPRVAVLRLGFDAGGGLSYPLDWVLATNQPAVFVLGPDARPEVWASLAQAGVREVYTSALWTLINHPHPLPSDRDLLASLTAEHGSAERVLQTLGNFQTLTRLLLPLVNEPPPARSDVPARLKPLLESILARRARTELLAAPDPFVAWVRHVADLPGPTNAVMQVHPVRTARHFGDYRLAAALVDAAPATAALRAERAGMLLDLGRFDAAFPLLRALHEEAPSDPDVAYLAAGTACWLARNGRVTGWPALPSLIERLVSEADSARHAVSAHRLDEHLAKYGLGVVRGALSAAAVQALLAAYRRFLQTLTAEQQQALSMGLQVTEEQGALVHQSLSDGGVLGAIARFLGSEPRFFASASFNRWRVGVPDPRLCVFHQDGRIGNRLTREVTCWLPLVDCGERLPGVDLIARRFFGFFPLGDGHVRAHRQSNLCTNDLVVEGTTWSPVFSPGDLLVFEKFTPHRTQPMASDQLEGDGRRFSMDLRWFSDQNV